MNLLQNPRFALATILFAGWFTTAAYATDQQQDQIKKLVDSAVHPVLAKYDIPGMAVGVTVHGTHYLYDYGLASKRPQKPVTDDTLFELGSITKTFTATLAAYAQVNGYLSLSDETGKYLPSLQDTKFGEVSLVNLGTHTAGGFPLQLPENIRNNVELMQYLTNDGVSRLSDMPSRLPNSGHGSARLSALITVFGRKPSRHANPVRPFWSLAPPSHSPFPAS
jgi:CubicO group peptidase (beta-lactamase class C family)